jgi:hypothetical protein
MKKWKIAYPTAQWLYLNRSYPLLNIPKKLRVRVFRSEKSSKIVLRETFLNFLAVCSSSKVSFIQKRGDGLCLVDPFSRIFLDIPEILWSSELSFGNLSSDIRCGKEFF